jgi:hypothetical protein
MMRALMGVKPDHPKIPLVLLPYACLIFISTAACMVEMLCWDVPGQQKVDLSTLYGPYLALCKFGFFLYLKEQVERGMWMRGDREKKGKGFEKRMRANVEAAAVMGIDMYSRLNGLIDHVEKEAKLKLQ